MGVVKPEESEAEGSPFCSLELPWKEVVAKWVLVSSYRYQVIKEEEVASPFFFLPFFKGQKLSLLIKAKDQFRHLRLKKDWNQWIPALCEESF